MTLLMNGDIYIKRGSEPLELSEFDNFLMDGIETLKESPEDLFEVTEGDPANEQALDMLLGVFQEIKNAEGEADYTGCDEFWISNIVDKKIKIIEKPNIGYGLIKSFETVEELNEKFISLRDFLEKAEYVGRYFRRTEPIKGDLKYTKGYNNTHVLYRLGNLMLAECAYMDSTGPIFRYETISPEYVEDGKYEFYGEVTDEYREKPELFQAILKQICDNERRKKL